MADDLPYPFLEDAEALARFEGWTHAQLTDLLAVRAGRMSSRAFDARYQVERAILVLDLTGFTETAMTGGALRSFLIQRGEDVANLDFRALVPVNIRTEGEAGRFGNRVVTVAAPLPLGEPDPGRRLARVIEAMGEIKASRQANGMEIMEEISEWGLTRLFSQFARLTAISRPFNVVITNVPGPQIEAYLLGSPLREAYPLVPLFRNQALGIALFSYPGKLFWGLNADWDALPDLHVLVEALASDFQELRKAAAA